MNPIFEHLQQSLEALQNHQPELAVARARLAVGLAPDQEDTWKTLMVTAGAARRWEDMLVALENAQARFPNSSWIESWRILALLGKQDSDQAIRVGLAALRKFPEDPELWHAWGLAWVVRQDVEAVLQAAWAIRQYQGSLAAAEELEREAARLQKLL